MPKRFFKTRECGCIVMAIPCGIKDTEKGQMYLLGGHTHVSLCDVCKIYEEDDEDTLRDMWTNDNITDEYKYAGWEEGR